MKYFIGAMLLSAASCLFGVGVWGLRGTEPTQFRTVPLEEGDLVVSVSASGTIQPIEVVDVGAHVAGEITGFGEDPDRPGQHIDYGSKVTEGALLAQIDDSTFLAKVDQMKANLRKAEAERAGAQARLSRDEKAWQRAEVLMETNSVSNAEHDKSLAEYEIAKADLAIAEADVLQAQAALKQAEIDLGFVTIKSPIDGVVIDRRVNVGQTLVAGLSAPSLFLLARDLGQLEIWASVNEADIGMVRIGQPVEFTVDAYPSRTFTGEVTQIRLNASMTQNVVAYTVIVACENPDRKLLPYMTANLKFEVARCEDAYLAPNRALRWRPALEQVAPEYREKFAAGAYPPASLTMRTDPSEEGDSRLVAGVVWLEAGEGLLRPVPVQAGLTDGLRCQLVAEELRGGLPVVIGEVSKQDDVGDFTSTFVNLPDN